MHHEDAVEGSFWRYGTDLADLYRDRLTLRQVFVRVKALPGDSPLAFELHEARKRAEEQQRSDELDDALTRYKRKG